MTEIRQKLFELQDREYAAFQAKLTPGVDEKTIIGVRIPILRSFAKDLVREKKNREAIEEFLTGLPHAYYDENLLHGILISMEKDYEKCIEGLEKFLPYVDNWAVCDTIRPKSFAKNKALLIEEIKRWTDSGKTYTCRFGMEMLMLHFLEEDFRPDYLEIPAAVRSEEYYVNMMVAWFFATALAKQWEASLPYLTQGRLGPWTHNKTIQKALESYRITGEQKDFLKALKV